MSKISCLHIIIALCSETLCVFCLPYHLGQYFSWYLCLCIYLWFFSILYLLFCIEWLNIAYEILVFFSCLIDVSLHLFVILNSWFTCFVLNNWILLMKICFSCWLSYLCIYLWLSILYLRDVYWRTEYCLLNDNLFFIHNWCFFVFIFDLQLYWLFWKTTSYRMKWCFSFTIVVSLHLLVISNFIFTILHWKTNHWSHEQVSNICQSFCPRYYF